ncbi:hypothetical protein NEUTE1DRAFT_91126, partial [Neurospora tetrasperma FGSC 2508]
TLFFFFLFSVFSSFSLSLLDSKNHILSRLFTLNAYREDRRRQFHFLLQVPDACDSKPSRTQFDHRTPRRRSATQRRALKTKADRGFEGSYL